MILNILTPVAASTPFVLFVFVPIPAPGDVWHEPARGLIWHEPARGLIWEKK